MVKISYISGLYPTTMQAYFNKYDKDLFNKLKQSYIDHFQLNDEINNNVNYSQNEGLKFYVNFSAYIILDITNNTIVDFAFIEFNDFVWILQIINIDHLSFLLPDNVYDDIKDQLKIYSDRLEVIQKNII